MTRIKNASLAAPSVAGVPTLAIVGRPNVGKSTLFNRIVGSRRAIVGDEPGITRDRLYGEANWRGQRIRVVDTGGIIPEDKELIPSEIFRQAKEALKDCDIAVLVVDGRSELASPDIELSRLLLRGGKPLILAVNKADSEKQAHLLDDFHRLGIREMVAVSAEHGRGVDDLLDDVLRMTGYEPSSEPETSGHAPHEAEDSVELESPAEPTSAETRIAIIGRPNVGKSTLLNRLTGIDRSIVSPIPGTTRDAIDEVVDWDGRVFRFVDTAGIRRKGKTELMAEKLSVVMARKHLEAADIALIVIDATEGVTALDATIAGYAHESGRSVIIVINKWDAVIAGQNDPAARSRAGRMQQQRRPADKAAFEQRVRTALKFLSYAPMIFISAATGVGVEKLQPLIEKVAAERRKRITTGEMNRFLKHVDFERASVPARSQVRILYMTQAGVSPPTFVIFTDRNVKLHFAYRRFLENQIREAFGFIGSPIWIKSRARNE